MISDKFDRPKPHLNVHVIGRATLVAATIAAAASKALAGPRQVHFREHDRVKGKDARFYKPLPKPKSP